jgi:hypothetical protein
VCIVRVFVWYQKNPARIKFVRNLEKKRIKKGVPIKFDSLSQIR